MLPYQDKGCQFLEHIICKTNHYYMKKSYICNMETTGQVDGRRTNFRGIFFI
jgi:hypothetical protein